MCFTKTTFQLTSQLLSWLPTINIDFSWSNTDLAISIRNLRVRNYFYVVVNPITVDIIVMVSSLIARRWAKGLSLNDGPKVKL